MITQEPSPSFAQVQPNLRGQTEAHRGWTNGVSEAYNGKKWTCLSESLSPATAEVTQFSIQLPQGLPPLRLSFGMDQIRQPLHLGQAQLSVSKGPPGELARFRRP